METLKDKLSNLGLLYRSSSLRSTRSNDSNTSNNNQGIHTNVSGRIISRPRLASLSLIEGSDLFKINPPGQAQQEALTIYVQQLEPQLATLTREVCKAKEYQSVVGSATKILATHTREQVRQRYLMPPEGPTLAPVSEPLIQSWLFGMDLRIAHDEQSWQLCVSRQQDTYSRTSNETFLYIENQLRKVDNGIRAVEEKLKGMLFASERARANGADPGHPHSEFQATNAYLGLPYLSAEFATAVGAYLRRLRDDFEKLRHEFGLIQGGVHEGF